MKTYLECVPCFFRQAIEAGRLAGADSKAQRKILHQVAKKLPYFSLASSPPEMARTIYGSVSKITGRKDPYAIIRKKSNRLALGVYGKLKKKISAAREPLLMAVKLAIAGNIIDCGIKGAPNIEAELERILAKETRAIEKEDKKRFHYPKFKQTVKKVKTILYLGDNAGETVFDRVLIEEIKRQDPKKKIIYAVRSKPIINDAVLKDAKECGIHQTAELIESGSDIPGTVLALCSKEFLKAYRKADMVISKGQGNFETFSGAGKPVFYLFMVKCPVVAQHTSFNEGDIILRCNS